MSCSIVANYVVADVCLAFQKAFSCRVGVVRVNEVVIGLKFRSGDCNGGWSMTEIALVSRCIIGA